MKTTAISIRNYAGCKTELYTIAIQGNKVYCIVTIDSVDRKARNNEIERSGFPETPTTHGEGYRAEISAFERPEWVNSIRAIFLSDLVHIPARELMQEIDLPEISETNAIVFDIQELQKDWLNKPLAKTFRFGYIAHRDTKQLREEDTFRGVVVGDPRTYGWFKVPKGTIIEFKPYELQDWRPYCEILK
jgi:hypothetical protein